MMVFLRGIATVNFLAIFLISFIFTIYSGPLSAAKGHQVSTVEDAQGWKLKVDGKDFYVRGVVWGYTPKDENYTYNLWAEKDDFIKKVLDYEFALMKKAGINAIRSFSTIPPKWVTYAYQQYGIMTAINPLMGRYGANVGGVWVENTDYSDPLTRETLKADVLKDVRKYKNVPGVFMIALGNESNYGLSWKSFEIENLPVGEQNQEKARYLYSLFGEVIEEGKKVAPNLPFTIVNGDIQYIDLIAKYGKNWDLLGVNAYRGSSFTGLWKDVKAKYGKPVLFFEFGSDAFNAKDFMEDQAAQAHYLRNQWQEMYRKSHGNGEEGNSIGGFVFEWRDEWWKHKQTENLDKQDRTASWANGGYKFDSGEGQNNMNEEWFGITRLGKINSEGFYNAEPRMAYDVLAEIFKVDPYGVSTAQINKKLGGIDMQKHEIQSEIRTLKQQRQQSEAFKITGATVKIDMLSKGLSADVDQDGRDGVRFDNGQMAFIDFAFQPNRKLKGDFTVNLIANAADSDFEFRYGDRVNDEQGSDSEKIELYDFQATYEDDNYNLNGFYHVPRYHWGYEGDFFGLLRETTDMEGQDIWNAKAPYGVEFEGKKQFDGLKVVAGPEVYWGANPKAIVKYQFGPEKKYTFMHAEDIARRDDSSSNTEATSPRSRQTTLSAELDVKQGVKLQVGGLVANTNKIDDTFDRYQGGQVIRDTIDFEDTLGLKARLDFDVPGNAKAHLGLNYAGLVADAGDPLKEFGTQLPYSALGNKKEVEAGLMINKGDFMIFPRVLLRENIVDANPSITASTTGTVLSPGIDPRNTDDDPFAVLDNREAQSAEIYLTYDPTPATEFYAWDNDDREDAKFAFNVGLTATKYKTATDSYLFFFEDGNRNAAFGQGLAAEDVWLLKSKMVFNPNKSLKAVTKFEAGEQQSTGQPGGPVDYYGVEGKFIWNKEHIVTAKFKKDGWGPYDFERQFNITYPEQYELGYTKLLSKGLNEKKSSKVGVKALYRTLDANSNNEFYQNGRNDDMFEIQTFLEYKF